MSSEQLIRRENKTNQEGRIQGELPQVAHYESLTVMDAGAQPAPASAAVVHRVVETVHGTAAGGIHDQIRTQKYETQGKKNQSGQTLATSKIGGQLSSQQQKNINYGATQKGYVADNVPERRQYAQESSPAGGQTTVKGEKTSGFTDAVVDAGQRGASYIGQTAVAGKDIAVETGKTAAEFAGNAAGVAKDAALVAGWGAAELAGEVTTGVTESMENLNYGVSGVIEGTAAAAESVAGTAIGLVDTVVDVGKKGASYLGGTAVSGKDMAVETGKTTAKTTAEFGGKAAGVAKDAALAAGHGAAELASETQEGVRESVEGINTGVGGVIETAAMGAEKAIGATGTVLGTAVDVGKKGASYIGHTMVKGKDITLQTGKTTAGAVKDATLAAGRGAAELAGDTTLGVSESIEGFNMGVGGVIESAAVGAEIVGGKVLDAAGAVVDLGKKGVGYVGEKAVAGKDITGEFVVKAADVAKDATLVAGWGAAELAGDTAAGVTESMETLNEGVAGLVEGTALATEIVAQKTFNTAVDVGKKGVVASKDITLESGKATAGVVGKGAGLVKGAALAAGRGVTELASGTAEGLTESMETLNEGVGVVIEGTARATENVAQKTYGVVVETGKATVGAVGMAADAAVGAGLSAAELAMDTAKATAGVVGTAAGATLAAGRGAAELASDTTKATAGAVSMVAGAAADTALAAGRGATNVALAAGREAAELAVDTTKATAGAVGMAAVAAADAGRGVAEFASDTTKATAGAVGKAAGAAGCGAAEFSSDTTGYVGDRAGRNTAGYGVRTNDVGANVGPDIVVERETITVDFKNQARESKKGNRE